MKTLIFFFFFLVIKITTSPIASPDASPVASPDAFDPIVNTTDKSCFLSYWNVFIYNEINDPITLHIELEDNDLGNRTVSFNTYTHWSFCLGVTLKTRFYAHFYWKSRTAFFDVYDHDTAKRYCENSNLFKEQRCFWLVRDDGFYISRNHHPFPQGWAKLHDWP